MSGHILAPSKHTILINVRSQHILPTTAEFDSLNTCTLREKLAISPNMNVCQNLLPTEKRVACSPLPQGESRYYLQRRCRKAGRSTYVHVKFRAVGEGGQNVSQMNHFRSYILTSVATGSSPNSLMCHSGWKLVPQSRGIKRVAAVRTNPVEVTESLTN